MSTVTSRPASPPRSPVRPPAAAARPGGVASTIDPIRVLRRHMVGIILAAVLGAVVGAGAFFALRRYAPQWSAEALFEIKAGVGESTQVAPNEIMNDDLVFRLAKSETILLTQRDVLSNAVNHPEVRNTSWYRSVKGEKGEPDPEKAVDVLEEEVSANVVRGSNFFTVSWACKNPDIAPVVVNRICEAYLTKRKAIDDAVYVANAKLYEDRLARTNSDIEALDRQIKDFIESNGLTNVTDTRYTPLAYEAEALVQQIAQVRASRSLSMQALEQTQAKLKGTMQPSPEDRLKAERDPAIQAHIQAEIAQQTELDYLISQYNDDQPAVRKARERLRSIQDQKEAKIEDIMERTLEGTFKGLQDEVERLTRVLEELEREAEAKNEDLKTLAANQAIYESMKTRREQLELKRDADLAMTQEVQIMKLRADASRVRLVQQAQVPREMAFPKVEVIVPLSTVLFVALTVGVVFLRELTDQRIKSASDIMLIPNANVLGVIPDAREDPTNIASADQVIWNHPNSVLAESYRQTWATIQRDMERSDHKTLLLMAAMPKSGATTSAVNLAATAAAAGNRVLLVDANFRRPQLAEALGVKSTGSGLGDVLAGEASLDDAIVTTERGVSVLSAGTPANRIVERLSTGHCQSVIAEARDRFDLVIFDAAPAVVAGEPLMLAGKVDAAILLVRANQEQRGLVARLLNQLADTRCELLGVLLNRPLGTAGGYLRKNYAAMAKYAAD